MEIRGQRECTDCGTKWSYYETGLVACPECGSLHSRGHGDRDVHTAGRASLDLTSIRARVDEASIDELAGDAADLAREYVAEAGFVRGGSIEDLSETYLAASELRYVGTSLRGAMRVDDDERAYFLELLRRGDADERPAPDAVPTSLRAERGLAVARSVDRYHSDLRTVAPDPDPDVRSALESIRTHRKRIEALDGDVDPRRAERLVRAIRDVANHLREGDETALVRAEERLDDTW